MPIEAITPHLGRVGVWASESKLSPELARELERLGYGAIWLGSASPDLRPAQALLAATDHIAVATGIVNVWAADPGQVAEAFHRLAEPHRARFLLGVGIGHPEHTAGYHSPYASLVDYLDGLDAGEVPIGSRALAALGPRVLRLAAERTAGAHPYLVTPEHTRQAREILGPDALLAPEQKVVLTADPSLGRALARPRVRNPYLGLSNYRSNLKRLGFTDEDLADGGSDRLIDALVAHGDAQAITVRVREHLDAGADHVALQLITEPGADPVPQYRALADALGLG